MPKIEEICIIAKSTNATIIGINESKLDESVLEPEIEIDDYKILRCDRNRHGGGVPCYIRNDLSYNINRPITVGTIYRPPNQSNFLEVLNENMNKMTLIFSQKKLC